VVRLDEQGGRELSVMRWGFPPPPKAGTRPVTNVRNVASPFWRNWLKPEFRCLVPATAPSANGATAGRRPSTGSRWPREGCAAGVRLRRHLAAVARNPQGREGEHRLFSFLTCESNDIVRPIHAKAMPVVLADEEAWDQWLTGSTEEALELQRPCPAHSLGGQAAPSRGGGRSR
jgi:putative SOS response-associated peptidase YedK